MQWNQAKISAAEDNLLKNLDVNELTERFMYNVSKAMLNENM